jgi:predicted GH43/DUF377 family glycosyl hydrolase
MTHSPRLERFHGNPILKPRGDDWESVAVFNPSATWWNGSFHLLYRAVGEYYPYVSRLGHAVLDRDLNLLERSREPVFVPDWRLWEQSVEDPRVMVVDGELYLTYVATPTPSPPGGVRQRLGIPKPQRPAFPRTALARMEGFAEFHRLGFITPFDAEERDVVLFPEKIQGRYAVLHRPANWVGREYGTDTPAIWFAWMDSLDGRMYGHRLVMQGESPWEADKIGVGPPPIRTSEGWLILYHGVDEDRVYRAGAALLDFERPWNVIARTRSPILQPDEEYEITGDVPNVVFPEGVDVVGERLYVFYGAADKVCCAATAPLEEFVSSVAKERVSP